MVAPVTIIAPTRAAVTTPVQREVDAADAPATIIASGFGTQPLQKIGGVKILFTIDAGSNFEDYSDGDGPVTLNVDKKTQTIISPITLGFTKTETLEPVGVFIDIG